MTLAAAYRRPEDVRVPAIVVPELKFRNDHVNPGVFAMAG
jgi:hypothetical protein